MFLLHRMSQLALCSAQQSCCERVNQSANYCLPHVFVYTVREVGACSAIGIHPLAIHDSFSFKVTTHLVSVFVQFFVGEWAFRGLDETGERRCSECVSMQHCVGSKCINTQATVYPLPTSVAEIRHVHLHLAVYTAQLARYSARH